MATDPTNLTACVTLAQTHVGDVTGWTPEQWQAQQAENSVSRGDPPQTYYRPYKLAISYLLRPDRVKARAEGDVSEQYTDVQLSVENLRSLDAEWLADRIPPTTPEVWTGQTEWGNW